MKPIISKITSPKVVIAILSIVVVILSLFVIFLLANNSNISNNTSRQTEVEDVKSETSEEVKENKDNENNASDTKFVDTDSTANAVNSTNTNSNVNTPKNDEKGDWITFENTNAGVRFKFPKETKNPSNLDFWAPTEEIKAYIHPIIQITVRNLDDLETQATMGWDKASILNLKNNLDQGSSQGIPPGYWSFKSGTKIFKLSNNVNAREDITFMVLEVCDVRFQRQLVFFHQNHLVVLSLSGPVNLIVNENPQYFTKNPQICGESTMWDLDLNQTGNKRDPLEAFYNDLVGGRISGSAKNWYELFDKIVSTIDLF